MAIAHKSGRMMEHGGGGSRRERGLQRATANAYAAFVRNSADVQDREGWPPLFRDGEGMAPRARASQQLSAQVPQREPGQRGRQKSSASQPSPLAVWQ